MGCQNCGSYDHPAWNCYMNGPGPSHYPPPMQGPMFNPGMYCFSRASICALLGARVYRCLLSR